MKRSDFAYILPPRLIAQQPLEARGGSRLLVLNRNDGAISHHQFGDLPQLLMPGDLLVFNDTRVIPARLWGRKSTGGRVEVLIERLTGTHTALAHIRASKAPAAGSQLHLSAEQEGEPGPYRLQVLGREGDLFALSAEGGPALSTILDMIGHVPLPPYITRADASVDRERYQTVYARHAGAVAAPTAGLHFTQAMLQRLDACGIGRVSVTLHVGAGTFQPVRTEYVEQHVMHKEYVEVSAELCAAVEATRKQGGRVIAVGTTAVRALETACRAGGSIQPYRGDTDIFIYPGYRFRCVDAMITNFHLPESTLLMLVSAFAGRTPVLAAYQAAIDAQYRFFSYGDAMFITTTTRVQADT